ncbi:polysaccharide lyase family 1 protein [Ideonella sp. TBM-1]|uniref:Polysaccharide lyase family 1 protein n=2 Tax=Ideonella livida TaxID=2707176 RepID=A0A7C9PFC0_9BURK|nr:polysaccharide lyase family 1 protein [Ideonella livida]
MGGCAQLLPAGATAVHPTTPAPLLPARLAQLREALPEHDGWAAAQGGTWGGADAKPEHVTVVRTRAELLRALAAGGNPSTPKIVQVAAMIDLMTDDSGRPLGEADFRDPAFSWEAYLAAYAPATWGKKKPEGPQEEARARSAQRQEAQVMVKVPSNTTLIGVTADAGFKHGGLMVQNAENVVIRHLRFEDAYDLFPEWDPKDGPEGEWNSEYDNLALRGASQVWIDHCTFSDGQRPDAREPVWLGRKVQHHDGLLDITLGSTHVTVSWNHFKGHDKTHLVGGSDSLKTDEGKLKVTFHHNWWDGVGQRAPRVRWGEVHVVNNLYTVPAQAGTDAVRFVYSIGVGVNSRIVSQANAWEVPAHVPAGQLVKLWKGSAFRDEGSLVNGQPVDLFAALQATHPGTPLSRDVGWSPYLLPPLDAAADVPAKVRAGAGAGR